MVTTNDALQAAIRHARAGEPREALVLLTQILEERPDDPTVGGLVACVRADMLDFDGCFATLRRLLDVHPGHGDLLQLRALMANSCLDRADALIREGQPAEALRSALLVRRARPEEAAVDARAEAMSRALLPAVLDAAYAAHRAGRLQEARGRYRLVLDTDDRQDEAFRLLHTLEWQEGLEADEAVALPDTPDRAAFLAAAATAMARHWGAEAEAGRQHPVFRAYFATPALLGDVAEVNGFGAVTRIAFDEPYVGEAAEGMAASGKARLCAGRRFPQRASEDYFEWIDLLESIEAAQDRFVMAELGAGYGRWLANAMAAIRRRRDRKPLNPLFIGVEAHPVRYGWMVENLRDNNMDPSRHRLLHAGVSGTPGALFFPLYRDQYAGAADKDFGARLYTPEEMGASGEPAASDLLYTDDDGRRMLFRRVETITLEQVLDGVGIIDLIDMDVQGAEYEIVRDGIALLDARVRKLHVGTHGDTIHDGVTEVLRRHGWHNVHDFRGGGAVRPTPYGPVRFGDGLTTWINPRLRPLRPPDPAHPDPRQARRSVRRSSSDR
ncbi:FkbM family methyltransferase [Azospirillum sp.]|uniref:FkbM family methyltransferase n=1 Tax=Azospirillum sp. TaxID=34012 RepID=UPI003D72EB58